jgi:alkyl sulfatase BDS1-like metallo-beta-lactamase superfamily hydrolase
VADFATVEEFWPVEVIPGVYPVRGADLANMTIVEGDAGITICDPLASAEAAVTCSTSTTRHRPHRAVVAWCIRTPTRTTRWRARCGRRNGCEDGKVTIYAPEDFVDAYVGENVYAGPAMTRRSTFRYGFTPSPGPGGWLTSGLGAETPAGTMTLIPPTGFIRRTGGTRVIDGRVNDGIEHEFLMAPESEAPVEMMWHLPKFRLVNTAEVSTLHSLYTLGGARTRAALKWSRHLNEALRMWGDKYDVQIGMRQWPT